MRAYDFKKLWIDYYVSKGHKEIENAPLIKSLLKRYLNKGIEYAIAFVILSNIFYRNLVVLSIM